MHWDRVRSGMLDELSKIANIDLSGLSPQTALESGCHAPPMETNGYAKALSIIDRAKVLEAKQTVKTAEQMVLVNLPQYQKLTGTKKRKGQKITIVERGKNLSGHTIGGMGIGRLVGEFAHGPAPRASASKMHSNKWWATAAGGAAGAGEFVRKRIVETRERKKLEKHSSLPAVTSPKIALQASRKVARTSGLPRTSGPSLKTQLGGSVIGRKFLPPGA